MSESVISPRSGRSVSTRFNEDGILTGGADSFSLSGMTVAITNSEIDHNGVDPSNRGASERRAGACGHSGQMTEK
jgi:hypothetical protein